MHKSTTLFNFSTSLRFYISLFTFCLFTFAVSFAQENKTVESKSKKSTENMIPNAPQTNGDEIKFKNETENSIITITDEGGNIGSITFPSGIAPIITKNKVYNENGTLKFGGFVLSDSGANSINELSDAKTGGASVFLGTNAGTLDDESDNRNTGLGQGALATVTTGRYNVGLGYNALKSLETAEGNIGVGLNSLFSNSIGNYNIGLGQGSQYYLTTGSNNTAIGYRANINNTTGSNNTIIGHEAGAGTASHNKSGNVFLGFNAGYNEVGDNKLYIENSISSSPLIWGDFATNDVKIYGDFEVFSKTKTSQLQVTSGSTNGYVLTSDASGNASWQSSAVSGATEINELTDAKFDGTSLFLGENAGTNDDATSNNNTSVGVNSLQTNTAGDQNTAIGFSTLQSNTTGGFNVALGRSSLGSNTTGIHNVGIGNVTNFYNEEGSNNTLIGHEAGSGSTLHNKHGVVFLGHQAGYSETSSDKLYIENSLSSSPLIWGDFAADSIKINGGLEVTSKTKTPLLQITTGATDGYVLTSDVNGNATWQESSVSASDDDWTINGSTVYHFGNVGIGVAIPHSQLSVGGSGISPAVISSQNNSTNGYAIYGSTWASGYGVGVYGTVTGAGNNSSSIGVYGKHDNGGVGVRGTITGSGGIAILGTRIGTGGIAGRFEGPVEITGKLSVGANPTIMAYQLAVDGAAAKSSGGSSWAVVSDIRLKNLLGDYKKGLSEIEKLKTVKFRYKENNPLNLPNDEVEYGFVAQEVQEIFPEAVNESTKGYLDFNMHVINVAMVNAVQELSKENDELKLRLEKYEEVTENLKDSISGNKDLRNEMNIIKAVLNKLVKDQPQISGYVKATTPKL